MPIRMSDTEGIAEPCRNFHSALCNEKNSKNREEIPGMNVNEG